MIGKEQSKRANITVSSGTGTATLTPVWDLARWIRVIPPNETDTYTITLKDGAGYIILTRTSVTGTFSELLEISLGILRSVVISSASADGTYIAIFDLH